MQIKHLSIPLCQGFKTGFWPSADADKLQALPKGIDNCYKKDEKDNIIIDFLQSQRDIEVQLGRYSKSFGAILLPVQSCNLALLCPSPEHPNFVWLMITQLGLIP